MLSEVHRMYDGCEADIASVTRADTASFVKHARWLVARLSSVWRFQASASAAICRIMLCVVFTAICRRLPGLWLLPCYRPPLMLAARRCGKCQLRSCCAKRECCSGDCYCCTALQLCCHKASLHRASSMVTCDQAVVWMSQAVWQACTDARVAM